MRAEVVVAAVVLGMTSVTVAAVRVAYAAALVGNVLAVGTATRDVVNGALQAGSRW